MKTVFNNEMCAHVWAQRSQHEGRSENMFFRGPTIYSYGTHYPIAHFTGLRVACGSADDQPIYDAPLVLFNSKSSSMTTTGKHKPAVHKALPPLCRVVYVPDPPAMGHPENMRALIEAANAALLKAARSRKNAGFMIEQAQKAREDARVFAEAFNLPRPEFAPISPELLTQAAKAARTERAEQVAARKEREAAKEADYRQRAAAWIAGENVSLHRAGLTNQGAPVLLRVVHGKTVAESELQTSLGAQVPLSHAIKAFRFIKLIRERGEAWARNGRTVRVGHFQIDKIMPNGDFVAGCHRIGWPEVERVARLLSVFDDPASDAAAVESGAHS